MTIQNLRLSKILSSDLSSKIFHAYNTRYSCTMSTSNITEDYFTSEPITSNPVSIDSKDSKKLKSYNNQTNSTDPLQTYKQMIHTDIIASTLTFLSNLNGIITITGERHINMTNVFLK